MSLAVLCDVITVMTSVEESSVIHTQNDRSSRRARWWHAVEYHCHVFHDALVCKPTAFQRDSIDVACNNRAVYDLILKSMLSLCNVSIKVYLCAHGAADLFNAEMRFPTHTSSEEAYDKSML